MIETSFVRRQTEHLQYRLIFAAAFAGHLPAAFCQRALSATSSGGSSRRSLLAEAWSASATTARMAFAG